MSARSVGNIALLDLTPQSSQRASGTLSRYRGVLRFPLEGRTYDAWHGKATPVAGSCVVWRTPPKRLTMIDARSATLAQTRSLAVHAASARSVARAAAFKAA